MSAPAAVALLLPTLWDRRQLAAALAREPGRYEVRPIGPPDDEVASDFDALAFAREVAEQHPDLQGVTSSSDYPGAVAAALVAQRLGLAGADPLAVLHAGHKGVARALHARVLPEAVPWFRLLQVGRGAPAPEGVRLPCFVKPVRGAFSRLARPVADARTLAQVVSHASLEQHARCYAEPHRVVARGLGQPAPDPGLLLAEELLHGTQVTVEGWVEGPGEFHALGVVDSIMVPGTHAFARFETPSRLPAGVQERLLDLTRRAVEALGLAWTCFNVEWIHEASTDRLSLLEVNPRLAGQFADLWEKTLGVNGYEVALALALGRPPPRARGGRYAYAASVPLRTFVPLRLERAPAAQAIAALEAEAPDTLIWWEAAPGEPAADCDALGEGQGERLAVINLGAPSRAALLERGEGLGSALLALADWGPGGARGSAAPGRQAPR